MKPFVASLVVSIFTLVTSAAAAMTVSLPCKEQGTDVTDGPTQISIANNTNTTLGVGAKVVWKAPATKSSGTFTLIEAISPGHNLTFTVSANLNGTHACSATTQIFELPRVVHP
jgi:hypothetical protein